MAGPGNTLRPLCFLQVVLLERAAPSGNPLLPPLPSYRVMYVTSNSDTGYDAEVSGWVFGVGGTRGGGHAAPDVAGGRTIRGNDRRAQRALAEYLLAGPRDPPCLLHGVLAAPERLRPQRPQEPHPVLLRLDQRYARAHDRHFRMGDGRDSHPSALPPA